MQKLYTGKKIIDVEGPLSEQLKLSPLGTQGLWPQARQAQGRVSGVCGFCSTGCLLDVHVKDGKAVNVAPASNYPVNLGFLCPKGWEAMAPLNANDRAVTPLMRSDRNKPLTPVSWDQALQTFTHRFKDIKNQYGPESVALLSTGQMATEEMALVGALFKFGMGFLHADSNTRQCMATAVAAYKESFGFDAPPYTYADLEESDCLVFVGSNLCIAHPILWERVCRNKNRPQIIVVDPRKTETASQATLHVQVTPGADLDFLYHLSRILLDQNWINYEYISKYTEGFSDFAQFLKSLDTHVLAEQSGVPADTVFEIANQIKKAKAASFWWTMGVNQGHQSTLTAQALINLALMTGHIGRPGTGANSITGQTNAMGSRLFSNTSSLFCGRSFGSSKDREEVASILGIPTSVIPTQNSMSYPEILSAVEKGTIKGLWIVATNPAHSWIHQGKFADLLSKLEFLVVQDMYTTTETALRADLLLPAAGWGEKEGTSINSERRICWFPRAQVPPGQALPDLDIFRLVASYWGNCEWLGEWESAQAVFEKMKQLSRGRPCDISGINDREHLKKEGGIQWPYPLKKKGQTQIQSQVLGYEEGQTQIQSQVLGYEEGQIQIQSQVLGYEEGQTQIQSQVMDHEGRQRQNQVPVSIKEKFDTQEYGQGPERERRLFSKGQFFREHGRALFVWKAVTRHPEPPDANYPYILLTGRGTSAQWHTQTRTGKSSVLRSLYPPHIYIEMNSIDIQSMGKKSGDRVEVESRRGKIQAYIQEQPGLERGRVFIPMHYPETNILTCAVFDPKSHQPAYKYGAVKIT